MEYKQHALPSTDEARELVQKELKWVEEHVGEGKEINDVQKFVKTAPGPPAGGGKPQKGQGSRQRECFTVASF